MVAAAPSRVWAAPANDTCANAEEITNSFPHWTKVVNITSATTNGDPPLPTCQQMLSRSVWYRFTPVAKAIYTISSCSDAPTATTVADTIMAIYTSSGGCAGPFTQVACDDDSCGAGGSSAAITTELLRDTTYYIVVWQFENDPPPAANSSVQLRVAPLVPPPNDTCGAAIPVLLNVPVAGTTVGATNNYRLSGSSCFTGLGQIASAATGGDVVYSFLAPWTGNFSFKVRDYNKTNLVLYVAGSCPTGPSPVTITDCLGAANRSRVSSSEEIVCLPLTNGQTVYVFVDQDVPGPGSSFLLEISPCVMETEPNDDLATASRLACGIEGSTSAAGDVDYFSLGTFPTGWRVFAMVDGEAASVPDFNLRVVTATDNLEMDDADNDGPFGQTSPNVAGTPLTNVPAFLRVSFGQSSGAEPYRLFAVVQPPLAAATPESEPNNTAAQADLAPNNYFSGSLAGPSPSTDVDVYAVSVEEGDLLFISLDGDPLRNNTPINGKLELLDEFNNVLVMVDDGNSVSLTNIITSLPQSPGEALTYRCPAEGTYYVRVSIGRNASTGLPQSGVPGAGDYLLSITKNCVPGSLGYYVPPALGSVSLTPVVNENGSATLLGTFTDGDVADAHWLTVDWGDGSPVTTNFIPAGTLNFNLARQYPDDAPNGTSSDIYTVRFTLTDGRFAVSNALNVTVLNVPPSMPVLTLSSTNFSENETLTLNGLFTDPGALDAHTVTITWGDGSPNTVLNLPPGELAFNATHPYPDDNPTGTPADLYTISVLVTDDDGGVNSRSVNFTVNNVAPSAPVLNLTPLALLENQSVTLNGSFTDPGALDPHQVEINWGDGSPNTVLNLAAAIFTFSAGHQYFDDNPTSTPSDRNTVTVTVLDDDGGAGVSTNSVNVFNVAPSQLTLGLSANPITENDSVTLNGSFADPGTLDPHTVVINWADGSPNTTLNLAAGVLAFSASHSYPDDNPTGTASDGRNIAVTVSDDDGGSAAKTVLLTVQNAAPRLTAANVTTPIMANQSATLTGAFTDAGLLDTFQLAINWGDGSTVQTLSLPAGGGGSFNQTHLYANGGTNHTIGLTLTDDDLGVATTNLVVVIKPVPVAPQFVSIARLPNGHCLLKLQGTPEILYQIQSSDNLTSWALLDTATADAMGMITYEDAGSAVITTRFYRGVLPPQ